MLADYMWIPAYYYVMGALLMFAVARGSRQKGGAKRMLQLYLLARMGKLFVSVIAIMCFCLAVHMEVPVVIAFIVNYFVYLMYDSWFFSHLGKRKFDLIISNPPYVTHQAMEELPAEYRHEPALALEAGDDGMDFMRRFMPALKEHLTENGVAIVEIGDGREAFEAIWPELPVTWLSTEEEEDMVFAVRAEDLQHL